ncbi:MAG: phosphoribosylglycinamide formyltransferase [Planctomycetes bacterium]|nr:phosphoribosylglycinamide formyltransferase [Planctomycetota bacterium]
MTASTPRLAVFVSGGGRSLENLVVRERDGRLHAHVAHVVSSSAHAGAIGRCAKLGVPSSVLRRRDHASDAEFENALYALLERERIDLVVLAGYLAHFPLRPAYAQRVLNIHPALLPAFGGKGFFGHHVHEAVLAAGVKVSGCTVHFVDADYDRGPIIAQRVVAVHDDDDADSLAARVFAAELDALPDAINDFAGGRLVIDGRRVRVRP